MDTSEFDNPIQIPLEGESYVCSSHFDEPEIRRFIDSHGKPGTCSYCGMKTTVLDFSVFMAKVREVAERYFTTVNNADLPLASSFYDRDDADDSIPGYIRKGAFVYRNEFQPMEIGELLDELELHTDNERLDTAIEDCFTAGDDWVWQEPLSATTEENDTYQWRRFCDTIKHKRRFSIDDDESLEMGQECAFPMSSVIDCIFATIAQTECLTMLKVGDILFRSRQFEPKEAISFRDLTSPPAKCANQNRMSPAGISMFYGSLDSGTSIAEIGEVGTSVYVGRFSVKKDLHVIDLTKLPRLSYWVTADIGDIAFLRSFAKEVSKPIERDEQIHIEYLPTQAFTEYVRFRFREGGQPVDGIIYNSSVNQGGKNVVLFCNQEDSSEYLELTDYKKYA